MAKKERIPHAGRDDKVLRRVWFERDGDGQTCPNARRLHSSSGSLHRHSPRGKLAKRICAK